MNHDASACRRAGRTIHELTGRLVAARLSRSPGADEKAVRRDVWRTLREHARLEDPNHLDPSTSFLAVWVLTSLLELEKEA